MWIVVRMPHGRLSIIRKNECRSHRMKHTQHARYCSIWYWNERSQQQKGERNWKRNMISGLSERSTTNTPADTQNAQRADNWKWHICVCIHNNNNNNRKQKKRQNEISTISFSTSMFCQSIRETCYFRIICTTSCVKLGQPCVRIRMKNERKRKRRINARDTATADEDDDDNDTMANQTKRYIFEIKYFFLFIFFFRFILRHSSTFRMHTDVPRTRYTNPTAANSHQTSKCDGLAARRATRT